MLEIFVNLFPKQTEMLGGKSKEFSAYFGLSQSGMDWLLDLSDGTLAVRF